MELPGETRAIKQAVLAFEVSGRISELLVKEGDVVKDGQVLARLDPRDLKAKLDAAVARRDASKPKMERARYTGSTKRGVEAVFRRGEARI